MFDRKAHIDTLKMAFPDWPIEKIEADADIEEKRHAKVKEGDKVLHINHSGALISDQDLEAIENSLKTVNYELSSYDTSGHIMASAEDFISGITIYLNKATVREVILLGIVTNAIWDVIKATVLTVFHKIRGKTLHTITSRTATEKNVTFNIVVNYDKDVKLKFVIENIPEDKIEIAIDLMKQVSPAAEWTESKIPQVAIYNPESNTWEIVNYNSEMLRDRARVIRTLTLDDYINELKAREKN